MKIYNNFKILVTPDSSRYLKPASKYDVDLLYEQIKRHIDYKDIEIVYDEVCSFCGELYDDNLPACCQNPLKECLSELKYPCLDCKMFDVENFPCQFLNGTECTKEKPND